MSSRPPRDGQYLPAVPSPLNPACPQDPSRQQKRCNRSRASLRKPRGPVSPSQRLMRQQAEAARRSLASKRPAQVQSATVVQIERRQSIAGAEEAVKKKAEPLAEHHRRPTLFIDMTGREHMGLGILVGDDLEKQQLARPCSDFGTIKPSRLHYVLPAALEHRIRGPMIMTQQRISLTVGILCVVAILSALFSHQERS